MTIYDEFSDYDINKAVAFHAIEGGEHLRMENGTPSGDSVDCFRQLEDGMWVCSAVVDYCDSWSDAGAIIEENKISIEWTGDDIWGALGNDGSMFSCSNYADKNPLRAAMIVYLMSKDK